MEASASAVSSSVASSNQSEGEAASESAELMGSQMSFGTLLARLRDTGGSEAGVPARTPCRSPAGGGSGSRAAAAAAEEDDPITQLQPSDVVYMQRSVPKVLRDRYLLGDVLGRGSFAKVREAYDMREKRIVALKIFHVCKTLPLPSPPPPPPPLFHVCVCHAPLSSTAPLPRDDSGHG